MSKPKQRPICEHVHPETTRRVVEYRTVKKTVTIPTMIEFDAVNAKTGEPEKQTRMEDREYDQDHTEPVEIEESVPERPCTEPAAVVATDMKEAACSEGFTHWVPVAEHYYCHAHPKHGTMTHLDGSTSVHPFAAIQGG